MFRICAVGLGLGLLVPLAAADLSGTVAAEHDGSPVVGAAVTLRSGGQVVAELETGDAGAFRANLPAAEYVVSATKASFTTTERRVTLTEAGADVFLEITKLGVISGRVTDNQGNGVRNLVIAAVPVPSGGAPVRVYNSRPKGAATDARGRYRIFGLPAGDYLLVKLAGNARTAANVANGVIADTSHGNTAEFYPGGRSPIVLPIRGGEEHTNIDFTSYTGPLFSVRGTVNGPGPDTPYRVSLVAEGVGIPLATATAQPGKEYQFDRVAPGTYKVVATRQPPSPIIEAINSGQIVINDANQAAIERILADARAAGLGPDGKPPEPAFAETTVTVVSQDIAGVTLSARPGIDAKLLYQPSPGCPDSVQLTLNPVEFRGAGNTGRRLEAGAESPLNGVPVGTYDVALNLPDSSGCYAATTSIDFRQVSSGATVPIVVAPMGGIQGNVDTTGYLAEEFTVALFTPDGVRQRTLILARDSSFSIPNVRPGRYRLSVTRRSANRVVAADRDVEVETGATARVEFPALP